MGVCLWELEHESAGRYVWFVSKAFQPSERNGAMVSILNRSFDA